LRSFLQKAGRCHDPLDCVPLPARNYGQESSSRLSHGFHRLRFTGKEVYPNDWGYSSIDAGQFNYQENSWSFWRGWLDIVCAVAINEPCRKLRLNLLHAFSQDGRHNLDPGRSSYCCCCGIAIWNLPLPTARVLDGDGSLIANGLVIKWIWGSLCACSNIDQGDVSAASSSPGMPIVPMGIKVQALTIWDVIRQPL
jgi:hypothetical protein